MHALELQDTPAVEAAKGTATDYMCVCKEVHPKSGAICEGCRASEMGRNCWEMDVSPCCNLPRNSCETCPVYAAAMRKLSMTERVRVTLESGVMIEGYVSKRRGHRMSDALRNPKRTHVAISDAVIKQPGDATAPRMRPVVLIAKQACIMVYPVDEDEN